MDPTTIFCPNVTCPARGQIGQGNIGVHSCKDKRFPCTACHKTFSATKGTAFYRLRTPAETVTLVLTLLSHGCPLQAIIVAPYLQDLSQTEMLSPPQITGLRDLLQHTPLGQHIVAFKIWDIRGAIIYSADPVMIGQRFPLTGDRARAWHGEVVADISTLQDAENYLERQRWPRLLEIYSPVRQAGTQQIVAVVEFYQTVTDLNQAIAAAQRLGAEPRAERQCLWAPRGWQPCPLRLQVVTASAPCAVSTGPRSSDR